MSPSSASSASAGSPGPQPLSAPPAVAAYFALSAEERARPEALQKLYAVIQGQYPPRLESFGVSLRSSRSILHSGAFCRLARDAVLSQGYDCPPETRRRLVEVLLATVPEIQPAATTALDHPLVPPTCVLLKLLGRSPAGTEQLARPDGLRLLLRLGGLERVAELPELDSSAPQAAEGGSDLDTDDEEEEAFLAKEALAEAEDDPLTASESEALRCLANTLTLHPAARDAFPDVVLADQRRGALRGLVRLLLCKRAGFLSGRLLFLLTSKPSEVVAELAHGGECIDALHKVSGTAAACRKRTSRLTLPRAQFAERFLAIYKSPAHRALLSVGPPTTTYFEVLKEHLKLAYNLMLQYSRAPPSLPEPFAPDSVADDVGAGVTSKKKRFWRSKSSSSGTDLPASGAAAGSPTPDVPPITNTDTASMPNSPVTDVPRSRTPASFAKRVVGAVKRSSPATSPKQQTTSPKAPYACESGEGNGSTSLSLTAAHLFLPLFRPYLVLATTLPLLEPAPLTMPTAAAADNVGAFSNKEVSSTVRAALNTLLNFPLELEELSGWSSSWLQYIPPRISSTDGTVLPGGGIGSLGERLLAILQAVCDAHFPADRVPSNPKLVTKHDREHGRGTLEAPCPPDEWLPNAGGEAQKVDEVLGPVVLLLRKLSMLTEAQVAFREAIFPANACVAHASLVSSRLGFCARARAHTDLFAAGTATALSLWTDNPRSPGTWSASCRPSSSRTLHSASESLSTTCATARPSNSSVR